MHYDFIAIPDADVPQAVDPTFQHVNQTYASEANKTVSVWRAVPDGCSRPGIKDFRSKRGLRAAARAELGGRVLPKQGSFPGIRCRGCRKIT